jgi:hypothetical protein
VRVIPRLRARFSGIKPKSTRISRNSICFSNLTAWAENGVLMLNTCLTVKANQAGSHSNKGWETFTDKVVDVVDKYGGANLSNANGGNKGIGRGVVFLAWGAWAAKRVAKLSKASDNIQKKRKQFILLFFGADETSYFNERRELLSPFLCLVAYIYCLVTSIRRHSAQTRDFWETATLKQRIIG